MRYSGSWRHWPLSHSRNGMWPPPAFLGCRHFISAWLFRCGPACSDGCGIAAQWPRWCSCYAGSGLRADGPMEIPPYLWDRGITHLDHVIGTHPQLDHVGGLAWTVQKFSVGHFWSNGTTREEAFYQRLQTSLRLHHIDEQTAEEGQVLLESGACRLRVLNP